MRFEAAPGTVMVEKKFANVREQVGPRAVEGRADRPRVRRRHGNPVRRDSERDARAFDDRPHLGDELLPQDVGLEAVEEQERGARRVPDHVDLEVRLVV